MKKIANKQISYLTRSVLVRSPKKDAKAIVEKPKDRGNFKVDSAGYFVWSTKLKK